ncbi:MAG: phytanoyl-CoA dioxygenase family protein [Marinovum sp.]|nr:phytanoyl-CoA dioxygenase family protein [Marinovum sp.]
MSQVADQTFDWVRDGLTRFAADASCEPWLSAALAAAREAVDSPKMAEQWRCEGTWFVGVDALDNDADGTVGDHPFNTQSIETAQGLFGRLPLHRAQLSVVRPGYPRPRDGESETAFRYRLIRDAAHVDGLLPVGPTRRRHLQEPHAWILGIALTDADPDASPLVVWPGSHVTMGKAFHVALSEAAVEDWADVDLTEIYQTARKRVFETHARVALPMKRGEAVLLHRHVLHGIAPWADGAKADSLGRSVAYFRPQFATNWQNWLD